MVSTALGIDIDCTMSSITERSASAPSSPNERTASVLREISNIGGVKCRRVTFPDDDTIVTGYFEAPDPWGEEYSVTTDNMVAAYRAACWKQGVKPLQRVLQQLQCVQVSPELEFELNLKGENLDAQHCEALEEIFKRLQFRSLLLEDCHLDDEGAAAIFDMIEYYDSTSHLNISGNKGIGNQGWQACSKMLKRTPCLQYLDASKTAQNEQSLLILGRAFRTGSYLVTLHLENCNINGKSLVILVAALKLNSTLIELFLGENKICSADGLQIGNLLRSNFTLQLLDLRSNNLQDLGICHLIDGLCQQAANSGECLKTLSLRDNHLTHNGMAHINRALLVSETLATLDIGKNNIGDEGIQHMKQGLLTNQSLENLGLSNSKITCEGAVALAEFIADNQHIASIDVTENEIKLAGLMALALSLKHNQSMLNLKVDQTIKIDESSDGMSSRSKLLEEINQYCRRNKEKIDGEMQKGKKVNFLAQSANVPVIRSEAELTSLIREKTATRSQTSGSANATTPSMVCSASFPNGSKSNVTPSSSPKNRFQVCRVFLDSDKHSQPIRDSSVACNVTNEDSVQSEESVFLPSSPNESGYDSTTSPLFVDQSDSVDANEEREVRKNYIRHQDSLAIHMQHAQSRRSNDDEDEEEEDEEKLSDSEENAVNSKPPPEVYSSQSEIAQSQLMARRASGGKVVKKLTFLLPDDFCENTNGTKKDRRRMSTPTLTSHKLIKQKQNALSMKLGRQLESLDLRSSVPLSPTRLREGLSFPEPLDKISNNQN